MKSIFVTLFFSVTIFTMMSQVSHGSDFICSPWKYQDGSTGERPFVLEFDERSMNMKLFKSKIEMKYLSEVGRRHVFAMDSSKTTISTFSFGLFYIEMKRKKLRGSNLIDRKSRVSKLILTESPFTGQFSWFRESTCFLQ